MTMRILVICGLAVATTLIGACDGGESDTSKGQPAGESGTATRPAESGRAFGTPRDLDRAQSLWKSMRGYGSWSAYPGLEGWQEGRSPHGSFLRYYVNSVAEEDPEAAGSIVVKENYPEKNEDQLGAITVMQKIDGYDATNADWFWVKFSADGQVMSSPEGTKLAGRVQGCIRCHASARGEDLLFVNDG